jgi:hypothetical protein
VRQNAAADAAARGRRLRLVTSFNEWQAGTEIELATEFGSRFLELTREFAGHLRGRSTSATQERQPP